MKRKRSLGDFEHVARYYKALNDPLNRLYIETSRLVGKSANETRMVKKALELINKARSDLEDRLFRELPEQATVQVFYGGQRDNCFLDRKDWLSEQNDREEDIKEFIKMDHKFGEERT